MQPTYHVIIDGAGETYNLGKSPLSFRPQIDADGQDQFSPDSISAKF
jgi:hypothetical protein